MLSLAAPLLYQLLRSQARYQAQSEGAREIGCASGMYHQGNARVDHVG